MWLRFSWDGWRRGAGRDGAWCQVVGGRWEDVVCLGLEAESQAEMETDPGDADASD